MAGGHHFQPKPPGWAEITASPRGLLFEEGDALTFSFSQSGGTYAVRDYEGTQVASGSFTGASITVPALPCGWYKLYRNKSTADSTTISGAITASSPGSGGTLTVADSSKFPADQFVAVIRPGTAEEEKVLVSSRTGTSLTVSSRGYDGTTARDHPSGSAITFWGTAGGEAYFSVFKRDSRFPANDAAFTAVGRSSGAVMDAISRGVLLMGPNRHYIADLANLNDGGSDGSGTLAGVSANVLVEQDWYARTALLDSARPRPLMCAFRGGADTAARISGATTVVADLYTKGVEWYEGLNEPNTSPSTWTPAVMAAQYENLFNAVRSGNANAKLMGPATVGINNLELNPTGWLRQFFENGGGDWIDGVSFHVYNSVDDDLWMCRQSFTELVELLTEFGQQNKPRWMTETGFRGALFGTFAPRAQARRTAVMLLMCEIFGVPKERMHLWYDVSHGFWDYAAFWQTGNGYLWPAASLVRTWSAELHGKTFSQELDLGDTHRHAYVVAKFTATNGSSVLAMTNGNMPDGDGELVFAVSGASSLVMVDTWGNETTLSSSSGRVTVPVSSLLTYLRVPSGVTVTARRPLGADFLHVDTSRSQVTATSGSVTKALNINRDAQTSSYWYGTEDQTSTHAPWQTETLPATVTATFTSARQFNLARVFFCPMFQQQAVPLDFAVQVRDPDTLAWSAAASVVRTPLVIHRPSHSDTSNSHVDSFFDGAWVFDCPFTLARIDGVRVVVNATTLGGAANTLEKDAINISTMSGPQRAEVREIQLFNTTTTVDRPVVVRL